MEVSVYAIPGTKSQVIAPDDFVERLNLKMPILIPKQKFQTMWPIFEAVCDKYKIDPVVVYRQHAKRDRTYVEIRQLTMTLFQKKLCKKDYERLYSLSILGGFFRKDHATVLHSIKTINNLIDTDKKFKEFVNPLFQ